MARLKWVMLVVVFVLSASRKCEVKRFSIVGANLSWVLETAMMMMLLDCDISSLFKIDRQYGCQLPLTEIFRRALQESKGVRLIFLPYLSQQ